jgi:ribosomal protein L11 methylase PrmA
MARDFESVLKAAIRQDSSATSVKTERSWQNSAKVRVVLDLCCYTGGFSVQAKVLGKADEVTGVDLDEEPLKLARENANLNQAPCEDLCSLTPSATCAKCCETESSTMS